MGAILTDPHLSPETGIVRRENIYVKKNMVAFVFICDIFFKMLKITRLALAFYCTYSTPHLIDADGDDADAYNLYA